MSSLEAITLVLAEAGEGDSAAGDAGALEAIRELAHHASL